MKEKYFSIQIYGQKAVDAGYKVNAGMCVSDVLGLGQMEVTIDWEGEYNGLLNKWVSVSYIKYGRNIPVILDELAKIGFKGCWCYIAEEDIDDEDSFIDSKELCFLKI